MEDMRRLATAEYHFILTGLPDFLSEPRKWLAAKSSDRGSPEVAHLEPYEIAPPQKAQDDGLFEFPPFLNGEEAAVTIPPPLEPEAGGPLEKGPLIAAAALEATLSVLQQPLPVYVKGATKERYDRYASIRRLELPVRFHRVLMPDQVAAAVLARAPHAREAIAAMAAADRQAVSWGGQPHFRPLLLIGKPGCGKSTVARWYHEEAGIPMRTQNVATMADAFALTGSHRTYDQSAPSCVLETLAATECANACLLLDEVDKAPQEGRHGSVTDALLGLLEPSEARRFLDLFLSVPADVSHVRWVLTANSLDRVPEAVRSRCRIVHVPSPGPEHVPALAGGLIREIAAERGISDEWFSPLDPEEIAALAEAFAVRRDIRQLRPLVERVLDIRAAEWARA
jgi:ATP-dependent Lon protease